MKITPVITRSLLPPLWECLEEDEKTYLRSFCKRGWKPPEFRFVSYNFAIKHLFPDGDFERERELNRTMKALPKDRYHEAVK